MTLVEEELDHVTRPTLPWRTEQLTECGLTAVAGRRIITRDAFHTKVARLGKTRAAMTTCITCWQTAARWQDWAACPSDVVRREVFGRSKQGGPLDDELRAIAALIEAHRAEFEGFLAGLADTTDLGAIRALRRRAIVSANRRRL